MAGVREGLGNLYLKIYLVPDLEVLLNKTQGYVKHFAPPLFKSLFDVLLVSISLKSVEGCRSIVKGNYKGFFQHFLKVFSGALVLRYFKTSSCKTRRLPFVLKKL